MPFFAETSTNLPATLRRCRPASFWVDQPEDDPLHDQHPHQPLRVRGCPGARDLAPVPGDLRVPGGRIFIFSPPTAKLVPALFELFRQGGCPSESSSSAVLDAPGVTTTSAAKMAGRWLKRFVITPATGAKFAGNLYYEPSTCTAEASSFLRPWPIASMASRLAWPTRGQNRTFYLSFFTWIFTQRCRPSPRRPF